MFQCNYEIICVQKDVNLAALGLLAKHHRAVIKS